MSICPRRCFSKMGFLESFINISSTDSYVRLRYVWRCSKKLEEAGRLFGKAVVLGSRERKAESSNRIAEDLAYSFPDIVFDDSEDSTVNETKEVKVVVREEDTIVIPLWTTHVDSFELYKTLRFYTDENYNLDSLILLKLIEEKNLPASKILFEIPFIHSGYLDSTIPKSKTKEK